MIRGTIFDVDGTLLDSMPIWEEAGARYLNSLGMQAEENLGKILFPMTFHEGAEYLQQHYLTEKSIDEIIQDIQDLVQDFYVREVPAKKGAVELLQHLRQQEVSVVIATSSERYCVEAALQRLGMLPYVEKIFTCDEVGIGKESPLVFQQAAEYMNLQPAEICVFEDALYAIRTAEKAGFQTAGVYDTSSEADQEQIRQIADIYLKSLADFQGRCIGNGNG